MKTHPAVQIIAYIVYIICYFFTVQLKNGFILEQHNAFNFLPEALFKILSVLILLGILFAKAVSEAKHPQPLILHVIGLLCAIVLVIWMFLNHPADLYPALYLMSEEIILFINALSVHRRNSEN